MYNLCPETSKSVIFNDLASFSPFLVPQRWYEPAWRGQRQQQVSRLLIISNNVRKLFPSREKYTPLLVDAVSDVFVLYVSVLRKQAWPSITAMRFSLIILTLLIIYCTNFLILVLDWISIWSHISSIQIDFHPSIKSHDNQTNKHPILKIGPFYYSPLFSYFWLESIVFFPG